MAKIRTFLLDIHMARKDALARTVDSSNFLKAAGRRSGGILTMSQVLQQQSKTTDIEWWKTSRSMHEIGEHLEKALKEKQELERRFVQLLQENNQLSLRCDKASAELTAERIRRTDEVARLEAQINEPRKPALAQGGEGRQKAELAAREKLIRDEFERKIQEMQLELNKERHLLAKRLEKMKAEAASCICKGNASHEYEDLTYAAQPKALRITYR